MPRATDRVAGFPARGYNAAMTRIVPTEEQDCVAFAQWLDLHRIRFSHVPMETFTKSRRVKGRNAAMGVRPGVPDYVIVLEKQTDGGFDGRTTKFERRLLFVEMKREGASPSRVSPEQRQWIEELGTVPGVTAVVCRGYEEAVLAVKDALRNW